MNCNDVNPRTPYRVSLIELKAIANDEPRAIVRKPRRRVVTARQLGSWEERAVGGERDVEVGSAGGTVDLK